MTRARHGGYFNILVVSYFDRSLFLNFPISLLSQFDKSIAGYSSILPYRYFAICHRMIALYADILTASLFRNFDSLIFC